MAMIDWF